MDIQQSRRRFLASASLAASAGVLRPTGGLAADLPPETTSIRLRRSAAICFAPYYLVELFLRSEGFEQVEWAQTRTDFGAGEAVARGDIAFDVTFTGNVVRHLDMGRAVIAVGGMHIGCYELFAREPIDSIGDLKGKRVGINAFGSGSHLYLSIMAKYIGLNAEEDIQWAATPKGSSVIERFLSGDSDAFLGFPPEPQIIRARGFDRMILNTTTDKPWSQYFCCMIYGNRDWVRERPVATKRFLRAIYKAAEFCATAPEGAARGIVDGGFVDRYDYALETVATIPYNLWHEYDSEDTLRFYALRLHEIGMLENHPNALVAKGTDWRFVNELRRELKA